MKLIIAETAAGIWNYHLRDATNGKLYLQGGAPTSICGTLLGWDTKIPLKAWGVKDHVPSSWCRVCKEMAHLELSRKVFDSET